MKKLILVLSLFSFVILLSGCNQVKIPIKSDKSIKSTLENNKLDKLNEDTIPKPKVLEENNITNTIELPITISDKNKKMGNPYNKKNYTDDGGLSKNITFIISNFNEVNTNLLNYTKIEKTILGESSEGAEASFYKDDNSIRKIEVTYYGEMGQTVYEFYYENNNLSFVVVEKQEYNAPMYIDSEMANDMGIDAFDSKKSKITKNKYYFINGDLIKWKKDKIVIDKTDELFQTKKQEILAHSQKLLNELN
jgi:hypothetical protein